MLRAELAGLLRSAGHDVVRASEIGQARADDALILERAVREERTLVTLDEHFGVIRIKAHPPSTENVAKVLLLLLSNRTQTDFRNRLVIVSANRARWIRTTEK